MNCDLKKIFLFGFESYRTAVCILERTRDSVQKSPSLLNTSTYADNKPSQHHPNCTKNKKECTLVPSAIRTVASVLAVRSSGVISKKNRHANLTALRRRNGSS